MPTGGEDDQDPGEGQEEETGLAPDSFLETLVDGTEDVGELGEILGEAPENLVEALNEQAKHASEDSNWIHGVLINFGPAEAFAGMVGISSIASWMSSVLSIRDRSKNIQQDIEAVLQQASIQDVMSEFNNQNLGSVHEKLQSKKYASIAKHYAQKKLNDRHQELMDKAKFAGYGLAITGGSLLGLASIPILLPAIGVAGGAFLAGVGVMAVSIGVASAANFATSRYYRRQYKRDLNETLESLGQTESENDTSFRRKLQNFKEKIDFQNVDQKYKGVMNSCHEIDTLIDSVKGKQLSDLPESKEYKEIEEKYAKGIKNLKELINLISKEPGQNQQLINALKSVVEDISHEDISKIPYEAVQVKIANIYGDLNNHLKDKKMDLKFLKEGNTSIMAVSAVLSMVGGKIKDRYFKTFF